MDQEHFQQVFLFFIVFLLIPNLLFAAVTFDATSSTTAKEVTSLSWTHTMGTGSDGLLVVTVSNDKNRSITSITYNGVSMTSGATVNNDDKAKATLYYLVNPSSGSNTVTVTWSAKPDKIVAGASSYFGVNQATPIGTIQTGTGNSNNPSLSVTSATDGMVVDIVSINEKTPTVGAAQTQRFNLNSDGVRGASSTEPGATSVTMSWSWTGDSKEWAYVAAPINCNSILPIELLSFEAKVTGNWVVLNWATATEIDNDFFSIERSLTAQEFHTITQIPGAGLSEEILYYEYTDTSPPDGISYYRLKQTDFDGRYSYGPIVSVKIIGTPIIVYPNPFSEVINVNWNSNSEDSHKFEIKDILGRAVFTQQLGSHPGANKLQFDVSHLSPGPYLVSMGPFNLKRFIKE